MSIRGEAIAVDQSEVGRQVENAWKWVAGLDDVEVLSSVNTLANAWRRIRARVMEDTHLRFRCDTTNFDPAEAEVK